MEPRQVIAFSGRRKGVTGGLPPDWPFSYPILAGSTYFYRGYRSLNVPGSYTITPSTEWAPWVTHLTIEYSGATYTSSNGNTYSTTGARTIGPIARVPLRRFWDLVRNTFGFSIPIAGSGLAYGFPSGVAWLGALLFVDRSIDYPNNFSSGGNEVAIRARFDPISPWPYLAGMFNRLEAGYSSGSLSAFRNGVLQSTLAIDWRTAIWNTSYGLFAQVDQLPDATADSNPANRQLGEPVILGLPASQWSPPMNLRDPVPLTIQRTRYAFIDGGFRLPYVVKYTFS